MLTLLTQRDNAEELGTEKDSSFDDAGLSRCDSFSRLDW
jgi:hypothetical protein